MGMPGSLTLLVVTAPCVPGEELLVEFTDGALMFAGLLGEAEPLPVEERLSAGAAFRSAPACAIVDDVGIAECAVASA